MRALFFFDIFGDAVSELSKDLTKESFAAVEGAAKTRTVDEFS